MPVAIEGISPETALLLTGRTAAVARDFGVSFLSWARQEKADPNSGIVPSPYRNFS